jgi:hypothetical protein
MQFEGRKTLKTAFDIFIAGFATVKAGVRTGFAAPKGVFATLRLAFQPSRLA